MRFPRTTVTLLLSTLGLLAIASPAAAQEYLKEQQNPFGTQPCNGGGCWTNYMMLADLDNDGDLDVIFPNANGFFSKGAAAEPLVIYQNSGTATFTDVSAQAVGGYTGWLRQVALADVTGDGFLDMYAPSAWGDADKFFINDGTGKFNDDAANRLPGVKSKAGAVRFGDFDNDGDLDLLVGDNWTGANGGPLGHLYFNDGTGKFTEGAALPAGASNDQVIDFDLFDMDGDFDLDVMADTHGGSKNKLWLNDGTGKLTDASGNIPDQPGLNYDPVACDVDGDGDLDVWVDNATAGYNEQLLINDGSGKFADETDARVTGNSSGADDNGVACIDIDGDGDLDAAIMSLSNVERILLNDGTGHFSALQGGFSNVSDPTLWFDFGDLNGDGRLDAATSQGEGNPKLNRVYIGTDKVPVDVTPPRIRAVEPVGSPMPGDAPVIRFGVSDSATTDVGPRLKKAYLKVTAPSASEIAATFIGGDLFRATLAAQAGGTMVTFEACAVDRQGNEGCSMPITYTVGGSGPATSSGSGTGGSTGGSAGSSATGAAGGTGGSNGGAGAGGTSGGSSGSSGGGTGGTDFNPDGGGGCGCAVPGADAGSGIVALALAAGLGGIARRRKSGARRAP